MILKLKYDPVRIFILKKLIFLSRSFFFCYRIYFLIIKKKSKLKKLQYRKMVHQKPQIYDAFIMFISFLLFI